MTAISTIVLATAAAASTAVAFQADKKSAKAAEESADLERAQAQADTIRQRRRQMAQARVERSQVANVGAQTGTTGSSSVEGGIGSINTQKATNVSFLDNTIRRSESIFDNQSKQRKQNQKASDARAVTGFARRLGGF